MQNNIPIFLSSDNNYAPFVATTIASICNNTKSFIDFYVLDGGITEENRAKIETLKNQFKNFSIEFIKIDVEKYFKDFPNCMHFTKTMYTRFLIPKLKPNLNKILYSDVDVIVSGDIREIYETKLENYTLGAVWDDCTEDTNNTKSKQRLNLCSKHKYFLSGLLLIDVKKWNADKITEKLFKTSLLYKEKLKWPDQDILNIVFECNYKVLPDRFNYTFQNKNKVSDSVIMHFETNLKPWHVAEEFCKDEFERYTYFYKYAKMTAFYADILKLQKYKTQMQIRILKLMIKRAENAN